MASVSCARTAALLGLVVVRAAALGLGRVGRGGAAAMALGSLRQVAGIARAWGGRAARAGCRPMWPGAEGAGRVAVGGGRSGGDEEATREVEERRKIFLCRAHGRLICGVAHTY